MWETDLDGVVKNEQFVGILEQRPCQLKKATQAV
jgi:hypothetical protein